jgi:CRP-like cAMP-binding protein
MVCLLRLFAEFLPHMATSQPPGILKDVFSKSEYTAAEIETIQSKFKRAEFSKHTAILRAGETARHYWYVETGFVRSYALNPNGEDITTHFYAPGDIIIDWPSFFLSQPTRETIETLTDCTGWGIDYQSFQQLFHTIPTFRDSGRTRLVTSYFELKRHSVSLIADSAADRYRRLVQEKPHITQNAPLKHIASYLGVTDTSLSRIRREIASK